MSLELVRAFFASLEAFDYAVLIINILLIIFARPILKRFSSGTIPDKTQSFRVNSLRGLNVFIMLVYGYQYFYRPSGGSGGAITLLSILAIFYVANLSNYLIQFFIHKQYGKAREIAGKTLYIETYQTRLLSILSAIILSVIAIIAAIDQLGFDSLLEAGGVLGIIGVFLGLTQSSWAPDIISGLIILNSDMFEEGDIVETDCGILGRVYKTKLFHTEILNIGNNHRIMIRNAHLRDKTIHNLSKFASAKGLRECLKFNIGYSASEDDVRAMFEEAFEQVLALEIPVESNSPADSKVLDTGDHAVTWGLIFHVKKVEQILNIRRDVIETVLRVSKKHHIDLATPFTHSSI